MHTLLGVPGTLQPGEQGRPWLSISSEPMHLGWGDKKRSSVPRVQGRGHLMAAGSMEGLLGAAA